VQVLAVVLAVLPQAKLVAQVQLPLRLQILLHPRMAVVVVEVLLQQI
jgi:hypothetical protein